MSLIVFVSFKLVVIVVTNLTSEPVNHFMILINRISPFVFLRREDFYRDSDLVLKGITISSVHPYFTVTMENDVHFFSNW